MSTKCLQTDAAQSFQLLIDANGKAALNFEHSWYL